MVASDRKRSRTSHRQREKAQPYLLFDVLQQIRPAGEVAWIVPDGGPVFLQLGHHFTFGWRGTILSRCIRSVFSYNHKQSAQSLGCGKEMIMRPQAALVLWQTYSHRVEPVYLVCHSHSPYHLVPDFFSLICWPAALLRTPFRRQRVIRPALVRAILRRTLPRRRRLSAAPVRAIRPRTPARIARANN